MKFEKALKTAIRAMKIQRRRHMPNACAYADTGALDCRGEYDRFMEYDETIEFFEELIEDEKNPVTKSERQLIFGEL